VTLEEKGSKDEGIGEKWPFDVLKENGWGQELALETSLGKPMRRKNIKNPEKE